MGSIVYLRKEGKLNGLFFVAVVLFTKVLDSVLWVLGTKNKNRYGNSCKHIRVIWT